MTLVEAVALALHAKKAREIAGMYCDLPYSQVQMADALIAFVDHCGSLPVTKEEHTHTARQLTAALARLAKYGEKHHPHLTDSGNAARGLSLK